MIYNERRGLSDRVMNAIIDMIQTGDFKDNRLPAESKLAEQFGVSVAIVREALLLLQEDGVITKKHGSGNYFHRSALKLGKRIDQYSGFREYLENVGYTAKDKVFNLKIEKPNATVRERLDLRPDEDAVCYERIISADGHPAVHCRVYLPEKLFMKRPTIQDVKYSLADIFSKYFFKELAYGQLRFFPHLTTEEDNERIGFPIGKPIIVMEELYFSLDDVPIAFCRNMFNDEYVTVNMLSH